MSASTDATLDTRRALRRGARQVPAGDPERRTIRTWQAWTGSAFMAPNIVLVTIFLLIPLVMSFLYSLQKLSTLGSGQWLGFNNYSDLFHDSIFWESVENTAIFTVITVPLGMAIGVGLAMLLNGVLPGRLVYRSLIFLPLAISGVATGVLGSFMFDQYNGFVNKLLAVFGISGPDWQSNGHWAMTSLILVTLWQRVGFDMIIYLAGLQGISPDLLEAAELDGASSWKRFRTVVFPLLGPSTFFLLVMNIIYSFQVFDTVYALTRGGPGNATSTVVTYAYLQAFDDHGPQELGYGAAIGIVIYLITLLITSAQWRFSRNRDEAG
ncbi:carbohydrate ABC transporter permease [Jatrophihabitans endophyticus]|uniref:carbohydrate ABC transporter permease n=1 Tax=Jatrophihabitans endophyticus TaxID=1206085 RepID=UPI001A00FD84|nr:sugar ABC transporter permease [Jatrophihabitans endophyticus]MBE7187711.1 sugar ABC transporter permease [Jatrophihabitans endophyticus]